LDIYTLGIRPTNFSTRCWRGFVATYAINRRKLVLKKLYTNNGNKINNEAPLINNKSPEISVPKDLVDGKKDTWKEFTYKNINLFIPYTGSILITKDPVKGRYVNMGFQSPFSYEIVIKLTFKDGKLISSNDLSDIAKSIRAKEIKPPENDDDENSISNWINDCFDISFNKKVNEYLDKK
jgi:hypothetical protein